jgi:hypothetical protein
MRERSTSRRIVNRAAPPLGTPQRWPRQSIQRCWGHFVLAQIAEFRPVTNSDLRSPWRRPPLGQGRERPGVVCCLSGEISDGRPNTNLSRRLLALFFSVLEGAINLGFNYLDCCRSTCRHHTGFGSSLKCEFPSPTTGVSQLDDGVFHSFVFHKKSFA